METRTSGSLSLFCGSDFGDFFWAFGPSLCGVVVQTMSGQGPSEQNFNSSGSEIYNGPSDPE